MNMYQPALNAYQHGQDQSLDNMFKLATAPTPASVFMQNLMQGQDRQHQWDLQDQNQERLQQDLARKQTHEDYLFKRMQTQDQNADEALKERATYHQGVNERGWDRNDLGWQKADDAFGLGSKKLEIMDANQKANAAYQRAKALEGTQNIALKEAQIKIATGFRAKAQQLREEMFQFEKEKAAKGMSTKPMTEGQRMLVLNSAWKRYMDLGDDDEEAQRKALDLVEGFKPQGAPTQGVVGNPVPPDLKAKYDAIIDPAKKAEAKKRLVNAGFAVP